MYLTVSRICVSLYYALVDSSVLFDFVGEHIAGLFDFGELH